MPRKMCDQAFWLHRMPLASSQGPCSATPKPPGTSPSLKVQHNKPWQSPACNPKSCPKATTRLSMTPAGSSPEDNGNALPSPVNPQPTPDLLVLDEPTTSIDAVTEQAIASAVRAHRTGKTTLVLTASPAFHAVADRIITGQEVSVNV